MRARTHAHAHAHTCMCMSFIQGHLDPSMGNYYTERVRETNEAMADLAAQHPFHIVYLDAWDLFTFLPTGQGERASALRGREGGREG